MIPVGIFVCLNSSEAGYELHNALEDGDVGDGDELLSDVEDRLKQRRCFVIPVARSGLKATYSMFFCPCCCQGIYFVPILLDRHFESGGLANSPKAPQTGKHVVSSVDQLI